MNMCIGCPSASLGSKMKNYRSFRHIAVPAIKGLDPLYGFFGKTGVKADFGRIVGVVANEIKQISEALQQTAELCYRRTDIRIFHDRTRSEWDERVAALVAAHLDVKAIFILAHHHHL